MGSSTGANIRRLRESLHLTQAEFAKPLGLTASAISQYESGLIKPKMTIVDKICETYHVPKSEFVDYGDELRDLMDQRITEYMEKREPETVYESDLAPDEERLIRLYRSTDERGRNAIMAVAESQRGDSGATQVVSA